VLTLKVLPTAWGVRNASPFNLKAEALLTLSGLPFEKVEAMPDAGPRGKLPVLIDGDRVVPDSSHIQHHLETVHGIDFDGALSPEQRADAEAYRRMAEEHLYFAVLHQRWIRQPAITRAAFFGELPWPLGRLVFWMLQRRVRRTLWGQGIGRHTEAEIDRLAIGSLEAIEAKLGERPFLLGEELTSVDCAVYPQVVNVIDPPYDSALTEHACSRDALARYCARCDATLFAPADRLRGVA
jgi:glutathione S-transferase